MKITLLTLKDGKLTPTVPPTRPGETPTVVAAQFSLQYEGERPSKMDYVAAVVAGTQPDESWAFLWDGHGNSMETPYTNGVNHVQGGTGANRPMLVNIPIYDRATKESYGGMYEIICCANNGAFELGRSDPFEVVQFKPAAAPAPAKAA